MAMSQRRSTGRAKPKIDERDGAATGDDDVLETDVGVTHERPRELGRRSLVAPDRVWGRRKPEAASWRRRWSCATLTSRSSVAYHAGKGGTATSPGDEFEPLGIVLEAEDAGRARKPGALEVPEQVMNRRRPWPYGSPNRVAAARNAALIAEPTGQDLLAGLHLV
jgi:hypothetical protein